MYIKDPFESKYQLVINGREEVGIKELKNPKVFLDYSQTSDDVYEHLEYHNPTKKRKDMIADMEANKKLSLTVTELFLRGRKLNVSLVFYITILFKSA